MVRVSVLKCKIKVVTEVRGEVVNRTLDLFGENATLILFGQVNEAPVLGVRFQLNQLNKPCHCRSLCPPSTFCQTDSAAAGHLSL